MTARPVFRFAPSPNGPLHKGHAYSALLNRKRCMAAGGRLRLRLEDIDRQRCRPEYEAAILADLDWLGFGFEPDILRQSERFGAYRHALSRLDALGVLYGAPASRAEIAEAARTAEARGMPLARDPDGAPLYPFCDRDRGRPAQLGEDAAIRLDMDRALSLAGPVSALMRQKDGSFARIPQDPALWGDPVLARRDTPTSYHLSVVVDDAFEAITDIVRGADLLAATAVHRLLQVLLGLPEPRYEHHRLILGADGRKLSKSEGAARLSAIREAGGTVEMLKEEWGL